MLFVANWKMNKSFSSAIDFSKTHYAALKELGADHSIVICPSFPALYPLADLFANSTIEIGAQDCSAHETGSYTGQVSAISLQEVGCRYCIIGHSEQRAEFNESNEIIAQKAEQLLRVGLEPIICIGENKDAYHAQKAETVLAEQLKPVLMILAKFDKPFVLAYEPIWAIGTGVAANPSYLSKIFAWLQKTQS